jgi:ABC-2 type transport system ATP-binding protein
MANAIINYSQEAIMLNITNLTKRYENALGAENLSFSVQTGEIAVLLGPNGAGKSTTIKCIAGLLKFQGQIRIDGLDNKTVEAKRLFGYVPETPALYDLLNVWEHMEFIARAYGLKDWQGKADEILRRFDLDDKKDKLGKELSKGMQQKVSICCALLINPKMVLFDEPMIGLDPKAIKELKAVFSELKAAGAAVLISTHIIDSIEEIWDRVLIMNKSRIVLSHTRAELEAAGEQLESVFFRVTEDVEGEVAP